MSEISQPDHEFEAQLNRLIDARTYMCDILSTWIASSPETSYLSEMSIDLGSFRLDVQSSWCNDPINTDQSLTGLIITTKATEPDTAGFIDEKIGEFIIGDSLTRGLEVEVNNLELTLTIIRLLEETLPEVDSGDDFLEKLELYKGLSRDIAELTRCYEVGQFTRNKQVRVSDDAKFRMTSRLLGILLEDAGTKTQAQKSRLIEDASSGLTIAGNAGMGAVSPIEGIDYTSFFWQIKDSNDFIEGTFYANGDYSINGIINGEQIILDNGPNRSMTIEEIEEEINIYDLIQDAIKLVSL